HEARRDPVFRERLAQLSREYVGRPTPLTFAERLTRHAGGARIYLKREDPCHTRPPQINNTPRPGPLAPRKRKPPTTPRTGAGRPAPGSTAWPPRRSRRSSVSSALSTWGKRTPRARR